jgi:hypothetical protein
MPEKKTTKSEVIESVPVFVEPYGVIKVRVIREDGIVYRTYEFDEFQLEDLGLNVKSHGHKATGIYYLGINGPEQKHRIAKRGEDF